MNSRSVIYRLPMQVFNEKLDRCGLEKTWYAVLATHIKKRQRDDLRYILAAPEFAGHETLATDLLDNLTIGEISALYEYSLAYLDRDKRKKEGQYFTPDDVAQVMAHKASAFPKKKVWLDPCSGVGNLSFWLAHEQEDPENFLKNNLYLVDRDALALFIARCLLTIRFQKKDRGLFTTLASRCIVADFLTSTTLPHYDYAILNPPYAMVEPDARFTTSSARDLYAYFLEKIMMTSSGFVSITPQTFTNGQKFQTFRKLLLDHFPAISVYCFDNVPDTIFRGIKFGSKNTNHANSTRAGIIVAKKNEPKKFRITPLLRWRVHERQELLDSMDDFLVTIEPTEDVFLKVSKELVALYDTIKKQKRTLAHLVASEPTPYALMVPSTPRYFISALKTPVERTSFRTLYFYNEQERNVAYLLINSSYMYWWWRIHDGGMTISEKTLLSLPVIEVASIEKTLLRKIETSETTCRVVKRNAGKDNENVKHDPILVREITKTLFPRFVQALTIVHHNSVFAV